jgi:spermidine/putrescine transport system ATP-binding protein
MNEGRIEQLDEPSKIYGFPVSRFVADFIGKCNILEAGVTEAHASGLRLEVKGLGEVTAPPREGARAGERGVLALRPEQVRIGDPHAQHDLKNHFAGKVHDLLYIGDVTTYIVELPNGTRIEALLPNSAPGRATFFEVGDAVRVSWRHDAGTFLRD